MWKDEKSYTLPILRIERPLRVLMFLSDQYVRVKLNHLDVTAGFTDKLFELTDKFAIEAECIAKSGWKKSYHQEKKEDNHRLILLMAPVGNEGKSSKITINVELKSQKILVDRVLHIKKLTIHEPESNTARINQIVKEWVMDLLKDNMGTLVTGAFSEVIFRCVELLFGAVQHLVGFFLPKMRN